MPRVHPDHDILSKMTTDELYQALSTQMPRVVYISGKTATGKSTFGRRLRDELGYRVIEFEAVLLEVVAAYGFDERTAFHKALFDISESKEKVCFIEATDRIIADAVAKGQPLLIEGAVANVDTLQRILLPANGATFVYFHPADVDIYIRNITSRFMQTSEVSNGGLPRTLWQHMSDEDFSEFCNTRQLTAALTGAIRKFAVAAQQDSDARLQQYRGVFKDITVVEIS